MTSQSISVFGNALRALPGLVITMLVLSPVSSAWAATTRPTETQRSYANAAVEALESGEWERAAALFRSSLMLGPLNVTHLNLGRTLQKLGRARFAAGGSLGRRVYIVWNPDKQPHRLLGMGWERMQ